MKKVVNFGSKIMTEKCVFFVCDFCSEKCVITRQENYQKV